MNLIETVARRNAELDAWWQTADSEFKDLIASTIETYNSKLEYIDANLSGHNIFWSRFGILLKSNLQSLYSIDKSNLRESTELINLISNELAEVALSDKLRKPVNELLDMNDNFLPEYQAQFYEIYKEIHAKLNTMITGNLN